ncbi:MAG TPA: hypothetical protein VFI54_22655 [Solirubrobacteraceae bacterium]|nr:hypothetical protein [Solirubrobacteraceae bacterium]
MNNPHYVALGAVAPADVFSMTMSEAGLVVTLFGLLGAVISLLRWRNKPHFVCGVLPLEAELADPRFAAQKLGQRSLTKAFRFEQKYFAMRLRRSNVEDLAPAYRSRLQSDLSCRRVTVPAGGTMSLPVILANYGGRTATDLTCSVILSAPGSKVKLCDAEVESLDYRVFALDQTVLREHAKAKSAPKEVVDAYTRVLTYIPVGDGVWRWGDLSANSFEVICLTLKVEVPSTWFELLFTINCSDGFVRAETYVQAIYAQADGAINPP